MKKAFLILPLLALIVGCSGSGGGYSVNGEVRGDLSEDTQVYLKISDENNQLIDVDTTTVQQGTFSFSGTEMTPQMHYIFIQGQNGNIPVILDKGSVEISAQKDSLMYAKVEGTTQNDAFSDFMENFRDMRQRVFSMSNDMQNAMMENDTANILALREEYNELQEELKSYEQNFVESHPDALISVLLIDKMKSTRTVPDSELLELFNGLSPAMQETTIGKRLKGKLESAAKTSVGQKAPNFSAPTPTGEQLALNDVMGKVTLIDFWAGWCRPCRAENPNIVRIYDKYKDKGLSILGVSLDRTEEQWKKAIADDGLSWHQVSNVQYFDEIAALYNVDAIPASFVLDENGIIVAKNLRGQELEAQIASMLP